MTYIISQYLSAQEIAELRLKGLPTTVQGINRRAKAETWPYVDRAGRGGGRLFALAGLPIDAAHDYASRQLEDNGAPTSRGRPKGSDRLTQDSKLVEAITTILAERPTSARNMSKLLANMGVTPPPIRSLQRFMARIEEEKKALLASVRDPDAFRSKYRLSLGQAGADTRYAHEVWEIDTTKVDLILKEGRKCVIGIIDRYSRRTRFEIVDSESAQSVRRVLINTIRAWGVMPARLKVDNGSGYMNKTIETALELLDIILDPCLPGTPQDKPFVERSFGTFTRERTSLLPGFVGHNVAQAQQLRSRARSKTGRAEIKAELSAAEFQAIMDAWLDGEYHVRTHGSLRCSPMQKWQASPKGARKAPSEGALKLALSAFVSNATVTKRGIQWKRGRYWAPSLAAWMGRTVQVRRDEDDLGALFIFDEDGRYIDTAVNYQRAGISQQQFASNMQRMQEDFMSRAKADLRQKSKTYSVEKAVDQLLRDEAEMAGRIRHLPPPAAAASTIMLNSLNDDLAATPALARSSAEIVQLPTAAPAMTPFERMAHTDALIAAAERGEAIDPDALRAARIHANSDSYASAKLAVGEWTHEQVQQFRRGRSTRKNSA